MAENLIEAQYDVTKKSKLKKFYEKNKILIFSFIFSWYFNVERCQNIISISWGGTSRYL